MLRFIGLLALLCVVCITLGMGKVVQLTSGVENFFLALAALSATVLISSYDAYETQSATTESDDQR
ncbi:hypothetical protein [Lichenihabitans psoromatis]|uniref:hypothetical protein n=1 Tax=Lichenihabitans psoromatis TaxID=2528642 RepID=UPI001035A432|nr:hypothetical protein [Lichenihabitans psoromatis]